MKKYGETLRSIREQKGYTLNQLADGILSVSFLSKFERGESDISLSYITPLLERLSISFEEFFYLHDGLVYNKLEKFFHEADEAYVNQDLTRLNRLRKTALQQWEIHGMEAFRCNTLMLDVYESIIKDEIVAPSEGSLSFLYEYLFKVESWGYYELLLYNSTMLLMPPEMVMTLSRTAFEKSTQFRGLKKVNEVVIRILLNTLIYVTGPTVYEKEYKFFLKLLESLHIAETDLHARNALLQIKGIYHIKAGHPEEGVNMVRKAISMLRESGSDGLADRTENYLEIVLATMKG